MSWPIKSPRTRSAFAALLFASVILSLPARAQEQQGRQDPAESRRSERSAQTVQVGAGTDNGTTAGFSGPKSSGGGEPPLPSAKLCDSFPKAERQACLGTVLRSSQP
jgi:hypothetical protein